MIFIAQPCRQVELPEFYGIIGKGRGDGLFDAVIGIIGETALFEDVVAFGECFFSTEREFALAKRCRNHQFSGIQAVFYFTVG